MSIKKLNSRVALQNGSLLDPCSGKIYFGDILIEDGRISQIGKISFEGEVEKIDCTGKVVTHGFCDLHVHFREPGREDKETLETGTIAALAGGFTRVCVMPNTNPPLDTPEAISSVAKKAENLPVYIHPIGAITKNQSGDDITEMGLMKREGAVAFSDDGLPVQDGSMMRTALEYSNLVQLPIINHAEDECLRSNGLMNDGVVSSQLGLDGNLDLAESIMIHRDLELASYTKARLHIPHVSSSKSLEHIRNVKLRNQKITAEVTPHHLYFNEEALRDFNTNLKVAPPIRTEADRMSLINAVKDGTIDCIATDHAPHTIEDKETTFDLASFGMIGLESCFGAVNKVLIKENGMSLLEVIKLLTTKPRTIMGFENDLFKIGAEVELTVLDPDLEYVFKKENIKSRSINSPYLGETMIGKINYTISKNMVYKDVGSINK
jgi:dihydroorotase